MTRLQTFSLIGLFFLFTGVPTQWISASEIVQTLFHTTFDTNDDTIDWRAERGCKVFVRDGLLHVEAQGLPQITQYSSPPTSFIGGEFYLIVEMRTGTESEAALYWRSQGTPRYEDAHSVTLKLEEDGHWHSYEFNFTVSDMLTGLRLRFSTPDGFWDIRSFQLIRKSRPPFSIREAKSTLRQLEDGSSRETIRFAVANDVLVPMKYHIGSQTAEQTLPRNGIHDIFVPIRPEGNLAAVILRLRPQDFPDIVCPVFLYRPEGETDWIQKPFGDDTILEIAPDARMARLWRDNELVGIIAPIVHREGAIPKFVQAADSTETELHFESEDVDLLIGIASPFLHFEMTDNTAQEDVPPLEGPVVRLFGECHGGLLPGVEFFKGGSTSSSEIDLEKPYLDRSRPNPLWVTMPLAVQETDKGGAALYWDDPTLQPIFTMPNRLDHTDDHRFSLIGSHIKASLEVFPPTQPDEESASFRILRSYVARKGFPSPPPTLRTAEEQRQLSMHALTVALQSEMGGQWGYAFESQWKREPYADTLSTLAHLTEAAGGRLRNPSVLVPGGSDITNDAIYFLSGRIPEWQRIREESIRQITAAINADGSFLFRTRFPEWETAASSFGYTALRALAIMEYVRATGNDKLFAIVAKALEYLEQCDIPGGGFYRDTPFHTPDLQAAAALVWLYVWAYEYNGNAHYLERAKHFAFAGLPFVYQTSQQEHMLYCSVGKFGGTDRKPPLHFGLQTTQLGIQYAYALNLLSQYDEQTDWKTVALGILQAVENLQYTEGMEAGCIPELFDVVKQEQQGWKVNPCALVSLRWAIEGKDSLFVLMDGRDRYVAPYPLRKTAKGIESYDVPPGQRFQILLNGNRYGNSEGNGIITID